MTRSEILEKARQCVCEDRDRQYGHPEDNFGKIAELWSAYRGEYFLVKDVAMMMALVKVARIYAGESIDSYVDLAGYAACGGELATEERHTDVEQQETENAVEMRETKPSEICKIPYKRGKHLVKIGKEYAPRGKFYFHNGKVWIGVDNSTGDLWVEEFITEKGCVAWLEGDYAADDFREEGNEE